ncbi:ferrous iron transport protein B [Amycolatopsis rhizosphaerae]|uniref:ferrous iron transport protein B n=1 Tax=Amycolatopsis rhizosphaerae TaxID=2053003 RepID=UPI001C938812|nr:ferrous iron transport protein B [Amycolatopsis rhizosphaerae]
MNRPVKTAAPSCHSDAAGGPAVPGAPVVALAGAPNAGKSTLFNALTGARRWMGNWPGTSVEIGRGAWSLGGAGNTGGTGASPVSLIDLPGAYSLDPASPDEELTRDLLVTVPPAERPEVVVVTVDAAHLSRSLYLLAQLREHPYRLVVALTMADVAERRGLRIDPAALGRELGAPVVPLDPRRQNGLTALAEAVREALAAPVPAPREVHLSGDGEPDELALADERFSWISEAVSRSVTRDPVVRRTWTDRIDRWVTAPVTGPLLFLLAMFAVFEITTTVAAPLQDALSRFFSGPVTGAVSALLNALGLGGGWVSGFVLDGLVAGVGMLLTFVPLMALMFVLLAVLEDSGYMARAAVVTDRLMRRIGLPGRAFLPLVVGFGCNVPAISATRALPNARHRVLTALLVPFTSCSARLTVYVLVATTFFPHYAGAVVFALYLASIVLVVLVGLALRLTLWRTMGSEPLMIDLPPYQRPTARLVGLVTWVRLKGFLRTAAGIIVAVVSLVWLLQAIPVRGDSGFGQVPTADSVYGTTAQAIAPVFEPAGFGQWQTASALMVGFVAKEAVISSWAQTYATSEPANSREPGQLGNQLRADFARSSHGHPLAAAWAFLIFLLAYTPCVATLAAQRREIGLKWTAFGIAVQLTVAWSLAVLVFQLGRLVL